MRKILRISLWILVALIVLAAGLFAYLRNADLSVYQNQIESFASRKIGLDLSIDGRFELYFGGTTRLVAEDVSLSNPQWEPDPTLLEVGHVTVVIDFWSLFSAPFIVEELTVRDIRAQLEKSADGQINWALPVADKVADGDDSLDLHRIGFRRVQVENVDFSFVDPTRPRPINATIEFLTVNPDDNDILDLDLQGAINELPLWADGKLGPWQNFVDGRDVSTDLHLTLGAVTLALEGSADDLPQLEGVKAKAALSGPDIARVLDQFGLPPFAEGEFTIEAESNRMDSGNLVRVEGNVGEISVFASGNIGRLIAPNSVKLDFNVAGPETKHLAELFGIEGAPAESFRVTGKVARDNRQVVFEKMQLQIGPESIVLSGRLEFKGRIPDGDVTVSASGHDFSMLGPFIGVSGLPAESFTIGGRLQKTDEVWQANGVSVVIGENRITADGSVSTGAADNAEIVFHAAGPDISILQNFTDLKGIPARTYDVKARIQSDPAGIEIEEAIGVFGDNRVSVEGIVAVVPGMSGTSLRLSAQGPQLHNVRLLTGVPYLPDGPFEFSGDVRIEQDSLILDDVDATAGDLQASAAGRIGLGNDVGSFTLDLGLSGPDAGKLAEVEFLQQITGDPFAISGRIEHRGERFETRSLSVAVGNLEAELAGSVLSSGKIIDVSVVAKAADAEVLRKLTKLDHLPAGNVTLGGNIHLTESDLTLAETEMRIGEFQFAADGTLSTQPRSNASDLRFMASGPSLQDLGIAFGADVLPPKVFAISGEFDGTPSGFRLRDLLVKVGDNDVHGEFEVDLREKPRVVGSLSSSFLDVSQGLQRLEQADPQAAQEDVQPGKYVFSTEALNTGWLQAANVDLELAVDSFIADTLNVRNVQIGIHLQDGALRIDPFNLDDEPGRLDGRLSLVPGNDSYNLDVSMTINDMHMSFMASPGQDISEVPPLRGRISLRGQGVSMHDIMASSNGDISLRHGAGKILDMGTGGSLIFGDMLTEVLRTLNPLGKTDPYRTVECAIYNVGIVDGVATIDAFAMQTDRMTMVATGSVNFDTERLRLGFRAKPREGIGIGLGTIVNSLLELGGTLQSPKISIDPTSSVTVTSAAVATGGLSLLARGLWDRMSAAASICEEDEQAR